MWLVGLGILAMRPMAPAGARSTIFNGFNTSSAVGGTFVDVEHHECRRRRDQCSARPHQARQSRCQASEELCRPSHACREEGWAYREGLRTRERDKRPFNVWTGSKGSAFPCIAVARPTGRRDGSDRPASGHAISLRATFKTRRVSQARGSYPRRRRRANVRCHLGECQYQGFCGEVRG